MQVWSTGQDQVAVIKRQLLRMVHGLSIFLDVDDLEDIGALERYIDETMVVLIFLSRGYFQSRNCLREVRAAMERARPVILVLETDETKDGFALEDAREECPEELRDFVFGPLGDERTVISWHRITVFQLCSLKQITQTVLSHTPLYEDKPAQALYLDADVSVDKLKLQQPLVAYASPSNPGCAAALKELAEAAGYGVGELAVVHTPPGGMFEPAAAPNAMIVRFNPFGARGGAEVRIDSISVCFDDVASAETSRGRTARLRAASELDAEEGQCETTSIERSSTTSSGEPPPPPGAETPESGSPGSALPPGDSSARRAGKVRGLGSTLVLSLDSGSDTSRLALPRRGSPHGSRSDMSWKASPRRRPQQLHLRKQYFVLYLNRETFVGAPGAVLARDVAEALKCRVSIVMLHENDPELGGIPFGHFFKTTPRELIEAGLYMPIAVAMHPAPHREVSLTLAAQALGASKKKRSVALASLLGGVRRSVQSRGPSSDRKQASQRESARDWFRRQAKWIGTRTGLATEPPPPPPRPLPRLPPPDDPSLPGLSDRDRFKLKALPPPDDPLTWPALSDRDRFKLEAVDTIGGAVGAALARTAETSTKSISESLCVICWDKPRTFAGYPCGHHCICESCAPGAVGMHCPICRAEMVDIVRIYDA